jgi:hypothetical protein
VNSLRSSLGRLLNASDGGLLGGSAPGTTAASGLATTADEIVKRLVEVGRHDCDYDEMQSWRFAEVTDNASRCDLI